MELLFQDNNELLRGVYAQLTNGYWTRVFFRDSSGVTDRKFIIEKEDTDRRREMKYWKTAKIIIPKKESKPEEQGVK